MTTITYNIVIKNNFHLRGRPYKKGEILYSNFSAEDVLRFIGKDGFKTKGFAGHIDMGSSGLLPFRLNKKVYDNAKIVKIESVITTKETEVSPKEICTLFPHLKIKTKKKLIC